MTDPVDPFEQELTTELHALVDAERAPGDLADRAAARLPGPTFVATRRGRLVLGAVAAAAAVVVFAVVAMAASDDTRDVDALDDGTTTTTDSTTTTTEPTTTTVPSTTTTTDSPGVAPPATTTTVDPPPEPACRELTGEGRDNTAWQTRWTTDPGPDAPARVRMCVDDITPAVGQVVTATVIGDDPDAVIVDEECGWLVLWTKPYATFCRDYLHPDEEPEPPPAKEVGHIVRSDTYVYDTVGRYIVQGSIRSSVYEGKPHPYASYVAVEIVVEAHA